MRRKRKWVSIGPKQRRIVKNGKKNRRNGGPNKVGSEEGKIRTPQNHWNVKWWVYKTHYLPYIFFILPSKIIKPNIKWHTNIFKPSLSLSTLMHRRYALHQTQFTQLYIFNFNFHLSVYLFCLSKINFK